MNDEPKTEDRKLTTENLSSRQTLSFLMKRFEETGIRPHSKFGQNFLIDLNLLDLLLESAAVTRDDVVLEVGTGTGSLTAALAQRAAAVVTVEIDSAMFQLAGEELHRYDNVVMLQVDALRNKSRINPVVLEAVDAQLNAAPSALPLPASGRGTGGEGAMLPSPSGRMAGGEGAMLPSPFGRGAGGEGGAPRRFKLVANLPYNIATPLLSNLLHLDRPPQTMTVTIQKELAERITARPGTKDYSALSIWIQSQCRAEIVRILPPTAFWPRPKVSSAFLQITLDESLRQRIPDRTFFHEFVRAMFFHRRKFLRSELASVVKGRMGKAEVDALLAQLNLDGTLRAESLDVDTMLALCEAVRKATGD